MTTGKLQQWSTFAASELPGRALVLGAEHVSFSALVTLAHAGAELPRSSRPARAASYAASRSAPRCAGGPVRPRRCQPARALRLSGVELTDMRTGAVRVVGCDTLLVTGDWIPDHAWPGCGHRDDQGTRGPAVDTALETSVRTLFAAGNLGMPPRRRTWLPRRPSCGRADGAGAAGRPADQEGRRGAAGARRVRSSPAAPLRCIFAERGPDRSLAGGRRFRPRCRRAGRSSLRSQVFRRRARLEVRRTGGCWPRHGPAWRPPGRPAGCQAAGPGRPSRGPVTFGWPDHPRQPAGPASRGGGRWLGWLGSGCAQARATAARLKTRQVAADTMIATTKPPE